jgi:hypothetical protein
VVETTVKRLVCCGFRSPGKAMGQVLVDYRYRNKCFFEVRMSHVLRFISMCDLFTDSPSYICHFKRSNRLNYVRITISICNAGFVCGCRASVKWVLSNLQMDDNILAAMFDEVRSGLYGLRPVSKGVLMFNTVGWGFRVSVLRRHLSIR